ncbi:hypothetical protein [Nitrosomonas ureae]|uniref:Uncharacterized protein n=1 Tax=Nitrosomonas ureae TaxID=44577 RepID=A0A2T5ISX9_9PROT|nr:hypothetical protein [Nitrosomonas ureae]PTQ86928.1 hypothetical protein C8R28_1008123 [Nitrosomonas ureae]
MGIEFKETDHGFYDVISNDISTGVELVKTHNTVIFDPVGCAGSFDIEELEQILSKMKELLNDVTK